MAAMQDGMPNCTAYDNEFDYRHNINDDQYLIYALGELAQTALSSQAFLLLEFSCCALFFAHTATCHGYVHFLQAQSAHCWTCVFLPNLLKTQWHSQFVHAGATENHFQIGVGHRESFTSNITSYADNILRLSYEGDEYCQTWYPYLDRNTGQLKARVSWRFKFVLAINTRAVHT